MSSELSTGKTIFILAVVVGCFAVLWPKVFYPMLTASVQQSGPTTQVLHWRDGTNTHHLSQLCFLLEEQQDRQASLSRWTELDCLDFVMKSCGITLSEQILEGFRLSKDNTSLTACLRHRFGITVQLVMATAPPLMRTSPYQFQPSLHPHARPERPSHLHPEVIHPALREKGRTIPQRTIEKQARPGPMPGIRPPMGGGGYVVAPQTKGSGAMGIIMPLYTVGIVVFFVYTIMKVLFKKNSDEDCQAPKLKDFHLDPEYRKYVFAEEYLDNANASHRDVLRRQEREASKQRRRQDGTTQPDTKIEDEQMDQLRRRLEETELAMERLMSQMGSVTDKLTAAKITEVLSQAQAQARILKDAAEGASDDDLTTSEAFTNTLSEDFSLPLVLQRHLEELKVKDMYLKGTSAGILAPPPISSDVASLRDEDASEHSSKAVDSIPLLATNDFPLNSPEKESAAVVTDPTRSDNAPNELNHEEEAPNEGEQNIKSPSQPTNADMDLSPKLHPLPEKVDFPLRVSSSLKDNLKNKQMEAALSSDIALYDPDREGSSDETETGADISELKSFADDGVLPSTNFAPLPVVEEQIIPEATYAPPVEHSSEKLRDEIKEVSRKPTVVLKPIDVIPPHLGSTEHGTQTDSNQLSVLYFGATYQIDKNEQNKGLNIKEIEDKVNEIILDATLPMDTQLLVKEAQTGSSIRSNIEIDATDNENEACVVTSQVSLAFVGLEQNEPEGHMTIIIPEKKSAAAAFDEEKNNFVKKSEESKEMPKVARDPSAGSHDKSSDGSTLQDDLPGNDDERRNERVSMKPVMISTKNESVKDILQDKEKLAYVNSQSKPRPTDAIPIMQGTTCKDSEAKTKLSMSADITADQNIIPNKGRVLVDSHSKPNHNQEEVRASENLNQIQSPPLETVPQEQLKSSNSIEKNTEIFPSTNSAELSQGTTHEKSVLQASLSELDDIQNQEEHFEEGTLKSNLLRSSADDTVSPEQYKFSATIQPTTETLQSSAISKINQISFPEEPIITSLLEASYNQEQVVFSENSDPEKNLLSSSPDNAVSINNTKHTENIEVKAEIFPSNTAISHVSSCKENIFDDFAIDVSHKNVEGGKKEQNFEHLMEDKHDSQEEIEVTSEVFSTPSRYIDSKLDLLRKPEESPNQETAIEPKALESTLKKTLSLESVELSTDLLKSHVHDKFTKDLIKEDLVRPSSPVPPIFQQESFGFDMSLEEENPPEGICTNMEYNIQEEFVHTNINNSLSDIGAECHASELKPHEKPRCDSSIGIAAFSLADSLVTKTTLEAMERILNLPLNEYNELKNKTFDPFEIQNLVEDFQDSSESHDLTESTDLPYSVSTTQSKECSMLKANSTILDLPVSDSEQARALEQPGEVGGSGKVEGSGEKKPIYTATVHYFSKVSPPGSPQVFGLDTPLTLGDIDLTQSSMQPESMAPLERITAVTSDDDDFKKEELFPQSSQLSHESYSAEESAQRGSVDLSVEQNRKG